MHVLNGTYWRQLRPKKGLPWNGVRWTQYGFSHVGFELLALSWEDPVHNIPRQRRGISTRFDRMCTLGLQQVPGQFKYFVIVIFNIWYPQFKSQYNGQQWMLLILFFFCIFGAYTSSNLIVTTAQSRLACARGSCWAFGSKSTKYIFLFSDFPLVVDSPATAPFFQHTLFLLVQLGVPFVDSSPGCGPVPRRCRVTGTGGAAFCRLFSLSMAWGR